MHFDHMLRNRVLGVTKYILKTMCPTESHSAFLMGSASTIRTQVIIIHGSILRAKSNHLSLIALERQQPNAIS